MGKGRRNAKKEGKVSRAMANTRVWRVAALLAGGLMLVLGLPANGQAPTPSSALGSNPSAFRTDPGGDSKKLAKSKLLQARIQLAQGNFDAAEATVQEVARLKFSYRPDEDSPAKVQKDIASARTDASALLQASRASLARKQFDQAEKYAQQAEKYASFLTFPPWGDTPAKALKDVAVARKAAEKQSKATVKAETSSAKPSTSKPAPGATPDATEKARALLKQARQSLQAGKIDEAKKQVALVRSMKPVLHWWEDSPDRVDDDIHKAELLHRKDATTATAAVAPKPAATPSSAKLDPTEQARLLLKQARQSLQAGKIDEAKKQVAQARGLKADLRFWEDSPDRVDDEIHRAELSRKKDTTTATAAVAPNPAAPNKAAASSAATPDATEKARALLQQARQSLQAGKIDEAKKQVALARDAKPSLHWWEDNPDRIDVDIRKAEALHKKDAPSATATVAVTPSPSATKTASVPPPASTDEATEKARTLVKQARQSLQAGKIDEAKKQIALVRSMKPSLHWWEDNPDRIDVDIHKAEALHKKDTAPTIVTVSATSPAKTAPGPVPLPRTKEQAKAQLAEGRKEFVAGKLDEAARTVQRVKSLTSASWGLFEDSPDRLQMDIEKARVKRDQEESARLLVEGRKAYEKGDYEAATRLAYRAQKLHGSYSIWDLGDRPNVLLSDIQTAQAQRKTALPPAVVVKNTFVNPTTPAVAGLTPASPPSARPGALPAGIIPAAPSPAETATASAPTPGSALRPAAGSGAGFPVASRPGAGFRAASGSSGCGGSYHSAPGSAAGFRVASGADSGRGFRSAPDAGLGRGPGDGFDAASGAGSACPVADQAARPATRRRGPATAGAGQAARGPAEDRRGPASRRRLRDRRGQPRAGLSGRVPSGSATHREPGA